MPLREAHRAYETFDRNVRALIQAREDGLTEVGRYVRKVETAREALIMAVERTYREALAPGRRGKD